MGDAAIRVEGLGKQYRISGSRARYQTLREQVMGAMAAPWKALRRSGQENGKLTIWALRDVSFDVKRGEVVGIIGRNGAGKSTLLKILSRITEPTTGEVEMHGRVGSLLEVGTGFNPELTGRENVYLNGAILGMRRAEIARKFDEIVAFAEIEKFLDTPVKHYSSGMYMRLAFAVAAHLEQEILVVDEVLAVGDADFQKRCLGKMSDVASSGRTVLFVSHNMGAVIRICPRSVWLDQGTIVRQGETREIVHEYLNRTGSSEGRYTWVNGVSNSDVDEFKLHEVEILNSANQASATLNFYESFRIRLRYSIQKRLPAFSGVGFLITTPDSLPIFETYDSDTEAEAAQCRLPGEYVATCEVPGSLLSPGDYILAINAAMPTKKNLVYIESALRFTIKDTPEGIAMTERWPRRDGVVRPALRWQSEPVAD
jgi:lipopolysaccharide transport system ATP-binding protein